VRPYTRELTVIRADCLSTVVNLNHFRLLRVVGKGAFGKVRIVERKDNGCTYALKYIRKDEGTMTRKIQKAELTRCNSGEIGERPKYYSRAADARAP
jgi:serine/threonine protein kinase